MTVDREGLETFAAAYQRRWRTYAAPRARDVARGYAEAGDRSSAAVWQEVAALVEAPPRQGRERGVD